jgi:hypothetical protein
MSFYRLRIDEIKEDAVVKRNTRWLECVQVLGIPEDLISKLGILELVCTAVYLIPQTSILGAILITGYFGGATATNLRIGEPFLGPVIAGMLVWRGLYLRHQRVRALFPLRRK